MNDASFRSAYLGSAVVVVQDGGALASLRELNGSVPISSGRGPNAVAAVEELAAHLDEWLDAEAVAGRESPEAVFWAERVDADGSTLTTLLQITEAEEYMPQRIVINGAYGQFSLSTAAVEWLRRRGHHLTTRLAMGTDEEACDDLAAMPRDHPDLVECIEALGSDASGPLSQLKVVEVPWDVDWVICEVDGLEWIAERHRRWTTRGEVNPSAPYTSPPRGDD